MSSLYAYAQPPTWSAGEYLMKCLDSGMIFADSVNFPDGFLNVGAKIVAAATAVLWGLALLPFSAALYILLAMWKQESDARSMIQAAIVICVYVIVASIAAVVIVAVAVLSVLGIS